PAGFLAVPAAARLGRRPTRDQLSTVAVIWARLSFPPRHRAALFSGDLVAPQFHPPVDPNHRPARARDRGAAAALSCSVRPMSRRRVQATVQPAVRPVPKARAQPAAQVSMSWTYHVLPMATVAVLATALYAPSLNGPFVYDDPNAISQSMLVRRLLPL